MGESINIWQMGKKWHLVYVLFGVIICSFFPPYLPFALVSQGCNLVWIEIDTSGPSVEQHYLDSSQKTRAELNGSFHLPGTQSKHSWSTGFHLECSCPVLPHVLPVAPVKAFLGDLHQNWWRVKGPLEKITLVFILLFCQRHVKCFHVSLLFKISVHIYKRKKVSQNYKHDFVNKCFPFSELLYNSVHYPFRSNTDVMVNKIRVKTLQKSWKRQLEGTSRFTGCASSQGNTFKLFPENAVEGPFLLTGKQ